MFPVPYTYSMKLFRLFVLVLVPFVAIDMLCAAVFAADFYRAQFGPLMLEHIQVWPAVLFYLLYSFAIAYLILVPALQTKNRSRALLSGALLGLTAYGTFDLVGLCLIAGWPLLLSVTDMAWGTVLTALVSLIAYTLATKWLKY